MDGTGEVRGTTTQGEYEMACARYAAISENEAPIRALIASMVEAVDNEHQAAEAELRAHERQPGIHKPYVGSAAPLALDEINDLRDAAGVRLAALLSWASAVIK